MELEIIILSKSERQIPYNITYLWNLKYDTNEPIWKRNRVIDIDNRFVVSKGKAIDGVGLEGCKLLYIEWINNEVLLYSTGNYIQYPEINHKGKEYINLKKCIYVTESLCYTAKINIIL